MIVDSGFRRGTDIFKALALGADAVGIGRPYLWGLGAFGQPGVERALDILMRELRIVMQQMGGQPSPRSAATRSKSQRGQARGQARCLTPGLTPSVLDGDDDAAAVPAVRCSQR